MTPVKSAQGKRTQLAWKERATPRSLAQRRADLEAQMREMALADLEQVAARLRNLHNRLERKTARNWTEQQIATETNVAYRTYQSWLGAKNENRDGTGYEKLARFYRRRLEDQSITRNWIVFGEQEQQRAETPDPMADLSEDQLDRIEGLLREMREMLGHLETADPKENS